MILLVHMIFGAAIAHLLNNIWLAIILALLGHYLLDAIPHFDYPIKDIANHKGRKISFGAIKIFLDIAIGAFLVGTFSNLQPIVYICVFFSLLPDGLTVLKYAFPGNKILEGHYRFHQKIHFLIQNPSASLGSAQHKNSGQEKIPPGRADIFWRIFSQVTVVIISITLCILVQ